MNTTIYKYNVLFENIYIVQVKNIIKYLIKEIKLFLLKILCTVPWA